jgi:predicted RNA-binding Zn ribbon-like protein
MVDATIEAHEAHGTHETPGGHETHAGNLTLLGGELCLDFANTADWHASDQPVEWLTSYDALVAWGLHTNILREDEAAQLRRLAAADPDAAEATRREAIELRETVYRIFSAVAAHRPAAPTDLERFNAALGTALAQARVIQTDADGGFRWTWDDAATLDRILWPVLRSAADLLTSDRLGRVRECADGRCGWLFLDTSRTGRRRWCSMESCGNRNKARRHYQRQREAADSAA